MNGVVDSQQVPVETQNIKPWQACQFYHWIYWELFFGCCQLCSISVQNFFPCSSTLRDLLCQQAVVFFCARFLWLATLHNLGLDLKTWRNCHAYWNMSFVFCSLFPIFLVENMYVTTQFRNILRSFGPGLIY